jgi:hypothetical protein
LLHAEADLEAVEDVEAAPQGHGEVPVAVVGSAAEPHREPPASLEEGRAYHVVLFAGRLAVGVVAARVVARSGGRGFARTVRVMGRVRVRSAGRCDTESCADALLEGTGVTSVQRGLAVDDGWAPSAVSAR